MHSSALTEAFPITFLFCVLILVSGFCSHIAKAADIDAKARYVDAGIEALAQGDYVAAANLLQQAAQHIPMPYDGNTAYEDSSTLTNLGTALGEINQNNLAIMTYKRSIDVQPSADAYFFLGLTLFDEGRRRESADAYAAAADLDPLHWEAFSNLGSVLHDMRDLPSATVALSSAIALLEDRTTEPTNAPYDPAPILSQLHYILGTCLVASPDADSKTCTVDSRSLPCSQLAKHSFSRSLDYDASNTMSSHMLASLTADATVTRASNEYVEALFDSYADSFEHSLTVDLKYTGYSLLRAFVDERLTPRMYEVVLDAGCGTGLVGEQFRNISGTLIGVDLSQAIINEAKARRPGLYDRTVAGDVVEILAGMPAQLDLLIAADSFIYLGDLDPLFSAISTALSSSSYAAFTLEGVDAVEGATLNAANPEWRWTLTPSGRFAHRKEYVVEALERRGMRIEAYQPMTGFRYENGKAVVGHLFIASKK